MTREEAEEFWASEDDARKDYPGAIRSFVGTVQSLAATERERDELRAEVERLRQLLVKETRTSTQAILRREEHSATIARVEALCEQWEEATVWPDKPDRRLRGAAARLRIALEADDA